MKLYGIKVHFMRLLLLRFETYKNLYIPYHQIIFVFLFVNQFIPIPLDISMLCLYNLLLIDYTNTYYTFRHLFNLPVNGQRTWGGGKSIKILKSQLYNYKLKKFIKYTGGNALFYTAEIVNLLWKYQWLHEWFLQKKYIGYIPWYIKRKRKYVAISEMAAKRVESFFKHPYKDKKIRHHKKKKVINKNVITSGFLFGFSTIYKTNMV